MRRLLNQLAHAAVRKRDCYLHVLFKRLSPRLGYAKAVWAIAHRLCRLIWKVLHEGVQYVERGPAVSALTLKRRKQRLVTPTEEAGILSSVEGDHGFRDGLVVFSKVWQGRVGDHSPYADFLKQATFPKTLTSECPPRYKNLSL